MKGSINDYYQKAKRGSLDLKHPGMKLLIKLSRSAKEILDLGCGEGTRLSNLAKTKALKIGVDFNKEAIDMAKKQYPHLKFVKANLENLSFSNEKFDLVYCAYVLEHLENPQKVVDESIRVLKDGGDLVFIAPNYGAPNRASPPFKGSRILKIIRGLFYDYTTVFRNIADINWNKVEPVLDKDGQVGMDLDTRVEPYISTLIGYLKHKSLKIIEDSSCWSEELPGTNLHQKFFGLLGRIGIYPFIYWGPHLVVYAKKKNKR